PRRPSARSRKPSPPPGLRSCSSCSAAEPRACSHRRPAQRSTRARYGAGNREARVDEASRSRRFETQRLLLRPFKPGDHEALLAIHSRPEVARYLYWEPRDEEQVRLALEAKLRADRL